MRAVGTVKDGIVRLGKEWEGKRVEVTEHKNTRSSQANRYYWGCVVATVADATGHDPEEVHDLFKTKFLKHTATFNGHIVEIVGSTASMKVGEFQDFTMKCERWAMEVFPDITFPTFEQYINSAITIV